MVEKKNPDYSMSAVNLCNPPEIGKRLMDFLNAKARAGTLDALLQAMPEYQELKEQEKLAATIKKKIEDMVEVMGSYQDIENGFYAVKQRRESIIYKPELVRQYAPSKVASFVLIESVDGKALDAMLKAGQITPEQARQCGEVKETFAYIIK